MSDFFEKAKDYLKEVPLWGWIGGGVILLLLVIRGSSRSEVVPVPKVTSVPDNDENYSQDKITESQLANQMEKIKNSFESKFDEQANVYEEKIEQQNELLEGWEDRVSALTTSYNERISTLQNQLGDVQRYNAQDQANEQRQAEEIKKTRVQGLLSDLKDYKWKAENESMTTDTRNRLHELANQTRSELERLGYDTSKVSANVSYANAEWGV